MQCLVQMLYNLCWLEGTIWEHLKVSCYWVNLVRDFYGSSFSNTRIWRNVKQTRIDLVSLLKNLVRADREGNWVLHITAVQDVLSYFASIDYISYLTWCSVYLEDMKHLPDTASEIYEAFLKVKFVVKRTPGPFREWRKENFRWLVFNVHKKCVFSMQDSS